MTRKATQLPIIDKLGNCYKCSKTLVLTEGTSLPKHNGSNGEECGNAGYSASDLKYRINTRMEAIGVATFIQDDDGKCLSYGGKRHSLNCRDGKDCEDKRLLLAKALADYFLKPEG